MQKALFSSVDVLRASKAIYSKEHLNPQQKRQTDPDNFIEMIDQLKQLGYDEVRCANALRRADYCIDLAGSLLMDNQDHVQELFDIIEIIKQIDDVPLDNHIDSIEKKKIQVPKSYHHSEQKPTVIAPSKSSLGKTAPLKPVVLVSQNSMKSKSPEKSSKKGPKLVLTPIPNGGNALGKGPSVLRASLPPLRKK